MPPQVRPRTGPRLERRGEHCYDEASVSNLAPHMSEQILPIWDARIRSRRIEDVIRCEIATVSQYEVDKLVHQVLDGTCVTYEYDSHR